MKKTKTKMNKEEIQESQEEYKIPLYNAKGLVTDYSIVDKNDYEELLKGNWYKDINGYAAGSINEYKGTLHKYLIKKYNIPEKDVIDHKNHNRLDNRLDNLRTVSFSQNSQNRDKISSKKTTSKYIGVCKTKNDTQWRMSIRIENNKKLTYFFDIEEHAAYCYDLLAVQIHGPEAKINGIEKPENFVIPTIKQYNKVGSILRLESGRFMAYFEYKKERIHVGTFDTKEEAQIKIIEKKKEVIENEKKENKKKEITRNVDGIAIINVYDLNKVLVAECLIDDDKWHELMEFNWNFTGGYIQRSNDNKRIHQYLLNTTKNTMIDHINNNPLDNRLSNLRVTNYSLNAHNRKSATGVFVRNDYRDGIPRYRAHVAKDGIKYDKTFDDKNEATKWRNEMAITLYGSHAKLVEEEEEESKEESE
jgi:hypothetical protein